MSVHSRVYYRAHAARYFAILPLVLGVVLAGCADGIFSPNRTSHGQIQLKPVFSSFDWQSLSADINVIRLTALELPARSMILRQEVNVDPSAPEWQLPLDVPLNSDIELSVELVNHSSTGDVTVYSGRTLLRVKGGNHPTAALVQVFPGPLDNLDITNLTIGPKNVSLLEGDQLQLNVAVVGSSNPTIIWTSSNPEIISVDPNGVLHAAGIGQATIQALAGPKSDNVTLDVAPRAASIQLAPLAVTLQNLNDEATFSARVVDNRNGQIDLPITYTISDPAIAINLGNGRFRALRSGEAIITATAVQKSQVLSASTTLKVLQTVASLSLVPARWTFSALGDNHRLSAEARDGQGNVIPAALTWSSSDPSVVSVDTSGTATAIGNGNAVVRVTAGSRTAEAQVLVVQVETSITLAPNNLSLVIGDSLQLKSDVFDARGNRMNVPVTWTIIGDTTLASISSSGVLTARKAGKAVVAARYNSLEARAPLTIKGEVTNVVFDRSQLSLVLGDTEQIVALLAYSDNTVVAGPITYSTADPSIATVSPTGVVSAVATGQTFIIASSGPIQARLSVVVVKPELGEIVIVPDLNVFAQTPAAPSNLLMLQNLVSFTGTGRGSGNTVLLNSADASCAFCTKTFDFMRSQIKQAGLRVENVAAGNGRLTAVSSSVKALFLFAPNGSFTESELSLLGAFVAAGGRLVIIGGHELTASKQPFLSDLLAGLGTSIGIGSQTFGCDRAALTGSSIHTHQITTGMTDFRAGCAVELTLGGGDVGLIYDQSNTVPILAVSKTVRGQN